MLHLRSAAVVVTSAFVGVGLATVARAVGSQSGSGRVPGVAGPVVAAPHLALASAPASPEHDRAPKAAEGQSLHESPLGRDDSEGAEGPLHPGALGDNPYDDSQAQRQGPVRVTVSARDGMLELPGGRFTVGSANPRAPANERPARSVTVASFWIDQTEVTVGAYRHCVDSGACAPPARSSSTCTFSAGDDSLPVSCVHWGDADAYCRFAGRRLPTEIEWEYAARGTFAVAFPWGGPSSCSRAVTMQGERSGRLCAQSPAPVGSHRGGESVFGVQDMSGNVEEWTADWYAEALGADMSVRVGAAHTLRGGGWLSPPSLSRTTSRDWGSALEAGPNVGFRCARDQPGP